MSYIKLFFTIYLSITLAGLTLFAVNNRIENLAAEQAIKDMESMAARAKFELERDNFMAKLDSKQQRTSVATNSGQSAFSEERRRKQEARKTNHEVCNFWRREYNKERSKYNKSMMDGACYRAWVN